MAESRISTLDDGYVTGDLSVYPEARDNKSILYEATNNAETVLKQSLSYAGKYVIVDSTDQFPDSGLLRVGSPPGKPGSAELIFYARKTSTTFQGLVRGFAGSRTNQWPSGSWVTSGVMAEHHNAVKDAILQLQRFLGVRSFPEENSLNNILQELETKFLSPRPLFRAFPTKGPPPMRVRFQNFSIGTPVRFLWDFGDGTTSVEQNPTHTFLNEGMYTIKLNMISGTGAQGVTTKFNYINVSDEERLPFFYVTPNQGDSVEKAAKSTILGSPLDPTTFVFVDQTDGDVSQRYWIFDDGTTVSIEDPNIHTVAHTYTSPGEYEPSLMVLFNNQKVKRTFLMDKITVF